MLAEGDKGEALVEEARRRLRKDDLPSVPARGDARGAMELTAHIAGLAQKDWTRVQAHAHLEPARRQLGLRVLRGSDRIVCSLEDDEERIPLDIHLHTSMLIPGFATEAVVARKELPVRLLAELVQQPRGALDVREQKGDGARRKNAPHSPVIMRPSRPHV
jgi:hypothetical protein